jgi:hypothetical protein
VYLPRLVDTNGRLVANMIDGVYGSYNLFVTTGVGMPTVGAKIDDLELELTKDGMKASLTVVPSSAEPVQWHAIVSQKQMTPAEVKAAKSTAHLSGTTSDFAGVFVKKTLVPQILGHDGATMVDSSAVNDAFLYVYVTEGTTKESFNSLELEAEEDPYVNISPYAISTGTISSEISFYSKTASYATVYIAAFDSRFGVGDRTDGFLKDLMAAAATDVVSVLPNTSATVPLSHSFALSKVFDPTGAAVAVDPESLYILVVLAVTASGEITLTSSGALPPYLKSKPVNWTYSDLEKHTTTIPSNDRFDLGHGISADGKYVVIGGHDSTGGKWRVHVYDETTKTYTRTTEHDWGLGNGRYYARGTSISGDGERIFITFNNDNDDSIYMRTRSGINFLDKGRVYKWWDDGYTGWNVYHYCEADYTGDHVLCFGHNRYYTMLRRKEDSQTAYEPVFINHSSAAQASTYLPGNIRWGYISHDGKMFMVYGWDATALKMFVRILAHDESSDTYKTVHKREDFVVRDNNIGYTTAAFSPDGRYYAIGINTDATHGTVFVYRHTGYSGTDYTYSLFTTINSDVSGITYTNFAYNTTLTFSGNSRTLLVGASSTVLKVYELQLDGYVYSLNKTITSSANSYVRMSYDGGSFLVPSGKFVYRVNEDPYVLFQLDQVETDFTITSGRIVIQGDFSNAYVFAVKYDPADSAFEKENTKMELETFVEQFLSKGSADQEAYRTFTKATNTIVDLTGVKLTKAFESFDAFGDTSAAPRTSTSNYVMVAMVLQGDKYFVEQLIFNSTLINMKIDTIDFTATPGISVTQGEVTSSGMDNVWMFALRNVGGAPAEAEVIAMITNNTLASADSAAYYEFGAVNDADLTTAPELTKALLNLTASDTEAISASGVYWLIVVSYMESQYYVRAEFVAGSGLVPADYLSTTVNDLTNYEFTGSNMTAQATQINCNSPWGVSATGTLHNFLNMRVGAQYYIRLRCFNGLGCAARHYLLYNNAMLTMGGGNRSDSRSGYYHYLTTPSGGWEEKTYSSNTDSSIAGWVYHSWEVIERVVTGDSSSIYCNQVVKDIKINLYTSEANARALNYQGTWGYALTNQSDEAIAALQEDTVPIYLSTVHATTEYIIERMNYSVDTYTGILSATPPLLYKLLIAWTQMVSEPFLRIEPQNVAVDEASRAISYDSTLIKTTTGGFEEAYLFALAKSASTTMTPAMVEDFVKWTIPFVTYSADELITVPASTNTLTTLAAGSFTKGFPDLVSLSPESTNTELPLNITLPSTHYSGAPAAKSTITTIEGGVELNGTDWKGYHPDLKLTPAIGTHYDLEVYLTAGSETSSDIVVGFMEDEDFSVVGSTISPSGGEVNVLWFFKFKPEGIFMAYTEASGGVAEGYALNLTDFAQFPKYHRVKFVETSEVAGATGVYALIYELYTDAARTNLFLAMPATTEFLFKGSAMAPSAFTDLPFRVYTYAVVDRTAVVRDMRHSSTIFPEYDLVGVARKEGKYYLQASPSVVQPLFDPASEVHLTERHLVWSDYDNAHTGTYPDGYVNALFPAIKNSTYQASDNGRGGPWGAFNQYYNAASSIPDGWGQAPSSAPYAYLVIDMTLYPGGSPNRKVFSRVKVWGWQEASQYPGDLRIHAADSLEELVTKPIDGEKVFDTFAFEAQRDAGPEISTQHQNEYVFATPLVGRYLLIEITPKSTSMYGINRFEFYGHDYATPAQLSWSPVISESPVRVDMVATAVADPPSIALSDATIKTKPAGFERAYVYAVNNLKPVVGKTLDEMAIMMAETEATGIHVLAGTTDAMVDLSSITLTQAFDYFLAPASAVNPNAPYTTIVVVKKGGEYLVKYTYPDRALISNRTINTEITNILTPGTEWNSFDSCLMGEDFMLTAYVTADRRIMLGQTVAATGTTTAMVQIGDHTGETSLNYTVSVVYAKSTERVFVCVSLEDVRHELYMVNATTMSLMKTEDISATLAGKEFNTTMHYHVKSFNKADFFALVGICKVNGSLWGHLFYVYNDDGSFKTYKNTTTATPHNGPSTGHLSAGVQPIRDNEMLANRITWRNVEYKRTYNYVDRFYFDSTGALQVQNNMTYYSTEAQFDSALRLIENGGIGISGDTVYFMNHLSSRNHTGSNWMYMVAYNLETEERKQSHMFQLNAGRQYFATNTQNWFAAENDEILWLSTQIGSDNVSNDLVLQRYEPTLNVYRDTTTPTFTIPDSGASENNRGLVAMLRTASGLLLQRVVGGKLLLRHLGLTEYVPDPAAPVVEDVEVRSSVMITGTTARTSSLTLDGYALPMNTNFDKLYTFAVLKDASVTYTDQMIQSALHYLLPSLEQGSEYSELSDVGFGSLDTLLPALTKALDSPTAPTTQAIVSSEPPVSVLKIDNKESFNSPQIYSKSGFVPPDYVFTFSGWFYVTAAGGSCRVFLDGGKNGITIRPNDASTYTILIHANGEPKDATTTANYNEWVLITFVSDKYGNYVKCYKNDTYFGGGRDFWGRYYEDPNYFGTNYSARDNALAWHSVNLKTTNNAYSWSTSKMVIGNSSSNFINGKFSKFALWHSALTIDDITSLYQNAEGWKSTNALYSTNNIYSFWSFENTLVDSVNGKDFSGSATYETIGSTGPPTHYSVVSVGKQADLYYATVFDTSDTSSLHFSWNNYEFGDTRVVVDDFTVADNALTITNGYSISTSSFEISWVFALRLPEEGSLVPFTNEEVQAMVTTYLPNSGASDTAYFSTQNVSYQNLQGLLFTHAFESIDNFTTSSVVSSSTYAVIYVMQKGNNFTAYLRDGSPVVTYDSPLYKVDRDTGVGTLMTVPNGTIAKTYHNHGNIYLLMDDLQTIYACGGNGTEQYLGNGTTTSTSMGEFVESTYFNTFLTTNSLTVVDLLITGHIFMIWASDNKIYYVGNPVHQASWGLGQTSVLTEITKVTTYLTENPDMRIDSIQAATVNQFAVVFKDSVTGQQVIKSGFAGGLWNYDGTYNGSTLDWTMPMNHMAWNGTSATYELINMEVAEHYSTVFLFRNTTTGEYELWKYGQPDPRAFAKMTGATTILNDTIRANAVSFRMLNVTDLTQTLRFETVSADGAHHFHRIDTFHASPTYVALTQYDAFQNNFVSMMRFDADYMVFVTDSLIPTPAFSSSSQLHVVSKTTGVSSLITQLPEGNVHKVYHNHGNIYLLMDDLRTIYACGGNGTQQYLGDGTTTSTSMGEFVESTYFNTFLTTNSLTVVDLLITGHIFMIWASDNKIYYVGNPVHQASWGLGQTSVLTEITKVTTYLTENPNMRIDSIQSATVNQFAVVFKDSVTGQQVIKSGFAGGLWNYDGTYNGSTLDWTMPMNHLAWNGSSAAYELINMEVAEHYSTVFLFRNTTTGEYELWKYGQPDPRAFAKMTGATTILNDTIRANAVSFRMLNVTDLAQTLRFETVSADGAHHFHRIDTFHASPTYVALTQYDSFSEKSPQEFHRFDANNMLIKTPFFTNKNFSWTLISLPTETRVSLKDVTVAAGAVTVTDGYALSTDYIDEVTLFAVSLQESQTITSNQIQSVAEVFANVATPNEAYKKYPNTEFQSLAGETLTHAFVDMSSPDTEPIVADGNYAVVAVAKQDTNYISTYLKPTYPMLKPYIELEILSAEQRHSTWTTGPTYSADKLEVTYDGITGYWATYPTNAIVDISTVGTVYEFEYGREDSINIQFFSIMLHSDLTYLTMSSYGRSGESYIHDWQYTNGTLTTTYGVNQHGTGVLETMYWRFTVVERVPGKNDIKFEIFGDSERTDLHFDGFMSDYPNTTNSLYNNDSTQYRLFIGASDNNSSPGSLLYFRNFSTVTLSTTPVYKPESLSWTSTSLSVDRLVLEDFTVADNDLTIDSGYALSTNGAAYDLVSTFAVNARFAGISEYNVELPIGGVSMTATINDEVDADPAKTPWILVLNYQHQAGTDPELSIRTTVSGLPYLPEDKSKQLFKDDAFVTSTLGTDDSTNTVTSWGHAGNDLFDKVCAALGSASGSENGLELRWTGISSERTEETSLHFVSGGGLAYFRTGSGSAISEILGSYEHLSGSTVGKCPEICTHGYSNQGDYAFNDFPYFIDSSATFRYNWAVGGKVGNPTIVDNSHTTVGYWAVNDTFNTSPNHDTYHQIWVRADLATCPEDMKAALMHAKLTTTQLQTMTDLYLAAAVQGQDYRQFPDTMYQLFDGLSVTHAFDSIDDPTTSAVAADGEYTVVAVAKQGTEYYSTFKSTTPPSWNAQYAHVFKGSFENMLAIDGTVIGNDGLTVDGTTYTTQSVGALRTDASGRRYLEIDTGSLLQLPPYTDTTINHTFYFVASSTNQMMYLTHTGEGGNYSNHFGFNIDSGGTGFFPIAFNTTVTTPSWNMAEGSSPLVHEGAYVIIVMKVEGTTTGNSFNGRLSMISKPSTDYISVEAPSGTYNIAAGGTFYMKNVFDIGSANNSAPFKLYEFGVINEYVSDEVFDDIVESLKNKYYVQSSAGAPTAHSLTWTAETLPPMSKVAVTDFAVADNNEITVDSGYALASGGVDFDKVWLFAVEGSGVAATVSPSIEITPSIIATPGNNAFTYDVDGDSTLVKAQSTTSQSWDSFTFDVNSIYVENTPGKEYRFSYKWVDTPATTFIHGFLFVAEDKPVPNDYTLITWNKESAWNQMNNAFPSIAEDTWVYVKVTVPETLGDLSISLYSDAEYETLISTRTISEAINRWNNQVPTDDVFNNTSPDKKWKMIIGTSPYASPDANKYVVVGNFREFIVAPPPAGFTEAQLQTMTNIFIENAGTDTVTHHEFANVSVQNFGGLTLTQAFGSIDSPASVTIDAANVAEYTTVGVGLKGDQFYAGMVSKGDEVIVYGDVERLNIPNSQREYTAIYDNDAANYGDSTLRDPNIRGHVGANPFNPSDYIQFNFATNTNVFGASTCGYSAWGHYPTSMRFETSMNGTEWTDIGTYNTNTDSTSIVDTEFDQPALNILYLRSYILTAVTPNTFLAMQIDLYTRPVSEQIDGVSTTHSLTWTAETLPPVSKVAVTDFTVADNDLAVNGGYALTNATPFDEVTLFAVQGTGVNESDIGVFPPAWTNSGTPTTLTVDGSSQTFYGETVNGVTYNVYASSVLISHRDFKGYNVFGKKYDDRTGYATPSVTTADGGWYSYALDGNPCFIYIHVSESINIKAYYISTPSPEYGADPEQWELDVSNDGTTWVQIETRENDPNRIANTVRRIEVSSYSGFYSWIRFKFIPTANNYVLQSDWRFEATTELANLSHTAFTEVNLQTMVDQYVDAATVNEAYKQYPSGSFANFAGVSFTHAFDSIGGSATAAVAADATYSVVAVAKQGAEYLSAFKTVAPPFTMYEMGTTEATISSEVDIVDMNSWVPRTSGYTVTDKIFMDTPSTSVIFKTAPLNMSNSFSLVYWQNKGGSTHMVISPEDPYNYTHTPLITNASFIHLRMSHSGDDYTDWNNEYLKVYQNGVLHQHGNGTSGTNRRSRRQYAIVYDKDVETVKFYVNGSVRWTVTVANMSFPSATAFVKFTFEREKRQPQSGWLYDCELEKVHIKENVVYTTTELNALV